MPPAKRSKSKRSSKKSTASGGMRGWLIHTAILAMLWGGIVLAGFIAYCALDLPDIRQVAEAPKRPSIVLEAEDGTVIARYGDLYGDHVTLGTVPKYLPQAIIAIEDRRFYSHPGIDILGIIRAMGRNVFAGHLVQGGSTLTQQLAKNLFLSPARTVKRKVQEAILALWLERNYTKDQIITAYMNRVYLGAGAYGVDAASRIYFDKPAHDLNLRECAILAGLLRAPSRLAPSSNAAAALDRAALVLGAMEEEGYITTAQKTAALTTVPEPHTKPGGGGDGRYFADWVAGQLEDMVSETEQDIVVSTTLDLALQRAAERRVDAVLARKDNGDASQAALITLAHDGAVRAMVGGRDYRESQFNRATLALRQPGSSFKPIVYLAALSSGVKPDDVVDDAPIHIGKWSPENFDGHYRGPITVHEALAQSINTVAVRLFIQAGPDKVIDTARALGITSPISRDAATALGASSVTPLELVAVYASLATGGRAITPYAIKEIRSRNGQILYRHPDVEPPMTVDGDAVRTLVGMMQDVVRVGTGKRAALDGRDVAGKTGTSSDYRDAWFMGFTGNYTTAVWMGNDDNHPMHKVVGGGLPAELWHDYMTEAEASLPERDLISGEESSFTGAVSEDLSKAFSGFIEGILGSGH